MKITTIYNTVIDTDKISDSRAEMIELIEKSGIREFAMRHKGCCYIHCGIPPNNGWCSMHFNNAMEVGAFVASISQMISRSTNGHYKCIIIPRGEQSSEEMG